MTRSRPRFASGSQSCTLSALRPNHLESKGLLPLFSVTFRTAASVHSEKKQRPRRCDSYHLKGSSNRCRWSLHFRSFGGKLSRDIHFYIVACGTTCPIDRETATFTNENGTKTSATLMQLSSRALSRPYPRDRHLRSK